MLFNATEIREFRKREHFIPCKCGQPLWGLTYHLDSTMYTIRCLNCGAKLNKITVTPETRITVNTDSMQDTPLDWKACLIQKLGAIQTTLDEIRKDILEVKV